MTTIGHTLIQQIDTASLVFVQHTVESMLDTMLGTDHIEQRTVITSDTDQQVAVLSDRERQSNRTIMLGTVAIGTTSLGALAFSPLYYASIPLVISLALPTVNYAIQHLRQKSQLDVHMLYLLFMGGIWLKGYFLVSAVGSILYETANKVLLKTKGRSSARVQQVFGQHPRVVPVLVDGVCQDRPFSEVQVGDIVVVRAGQPIPVDGIIVYGQATIDQQMLTGEARPVEKQVGDLVLAPTIVLAGELHIQVDKTGSETVAAQILQTLMSMDEYEQESELRATRFANALVTPLLVCSGIALLVVGSTGALGVLGAGNIFLLSVTNPIAMLNFLNIAAQRGILVKDARTLDRLSTVDVIVFDKTGTLTLDQPRVTAIHACPGFDEQLVLAYAAASEQHQTHPIAQAILQEAASRELALPANDYVSYLMGYGLRVTIGETIVRVGSRRFVEQEGIHIPSAILEVAQQAELLGHSLVLIGINESLGGAIELQPTLRPETAAVMAALQQQGFELAILSGDQDEPTRRLAERLGVQTYFANTLPVQKAEVIQQFQADGKTVCFVGDGINDALALKQAEVSISLRGATSIAVDTAQVVLMNQHLDHILELLQLARTANTNLKLSIACYTIPDAILIGGVFLAGWGPYAAYTAFVASLMGGLGVAMAPLAQQRLSGRKR